MHTAPTRGPRWARTACLCALAVSALIGCARELSVPARAGRQGRADAVGLPVDATPADAGPAADATPPPIPLTPAPWVSWWIVHDAPWSAGLRAALRPPQPPASDAVALEAPADGFLVVWAGPDSPGASTLRALRAQGLAAAPLYRLRDRLPDLAADVGGLAARALDRPGLTLGGRPVIAVDGTGVPAEALAAVGDALAARPIDVAWVVVLDDDAPLPAGAAAVIPAAAYGHALSGDALPSGADAARLARQRAGVQAAGLGWLPRARPGINRRLADPQAVVEPPASEGLRRSLRLARRAAAPVVVVDGLGAWADDRQLDPVSGGASAEPTALTSGLSYTAYGTERLDAVRDTLHAPAGPPPADLGRRPELTLLFAAPGVTGGAEYDGRGLRLQVQDAGGATGRRLEWLVDGRPWIVPAGVHLAYSRSTSVIAFDLVFADGRRLLALAPDAGDAAVRIPLDAFAGARVEGVVAVTFGGQPRLDARLDDLRLAPR